MVCRCIHLLQDFSPPYAPKNSSSLSIYHVPPSSPPPLLPCIYDPKYAVSLWDFFFFFFFIFYIIFFFFLFFFFFFFYHLYSIIILLLQAYIGKAFFFFPVRHGPRQRNGKPFTFRLRCQIAKGRLPQGLPKFPALSRGRLVLYMYILRTF